MRPKKEAYTLAKIFHSTFHASMSTCILYKFSFTMRRVLAKGQAGILFSSFAHLCPRLSQQMQKIKNKFSLCEWESVFPKFMAMWKICRLSMTHLCFVRRGWSGLHSFFVQKVCGAYRTDSFKFPQTRLFFDTLKVISYAELLVIEEQNLISYLKCRGYRLPSH